MEKVRDFNRSASTAESDTRPRPTTQDAIKNIITGLNRERQASEGLRAELGTAEKTVQLLSSVLQHKGVDLKNYIG